MEPAVVSVFIKSDSQRKRAPRVGEMVRLDGRYGLYTVISVDRKRRVADLVHNGAKCDFVENVAFSQIRGVAKGISEAIEEFLNSPILNRNAGTKAPSPKSSELYGSGEGSVVPR